MRLSFVDWRGGEGERGEVDPDEKARDGTKDPNARPEE